MKRTNADKRRAVEIALKEFGNLSDRQIAEICAVGAPMVGKVRQETCNNVTPEKRLGSDGKIYPAQVMRHEPRGETESAPTEEKPPVGGALADIEETARDIDRKSPPRISTRGMSQTRTSSPRQARP